MKSDPEAKDSQKRMTRIKQGLKKSGLKLTPQRLEIFNEVAKSGTHPDAETVYRAVRERMPSVSLDTVYRTLWLLSDMGLIAALGPAREKARFDSNTEPHHHFICRQCGKILDFYSPDLDRLPVPEAAQTLGQSEKINVEIRGLCRACLEEKE
ncbi:MAG: transcriptional repressor [Desulfobacteraceae bacterium]|nr:MAG: transcriptional repressor [Desulfobacteraceae bacterium]